MCSVSYSTLDQLQGGIEKVENFFGMDRKTGELIYGHLLFYYENMEIIGQVLLIAAIVLLVVFFIESLILISNNTKRTIIEMSMSNQENKNQ